MKVILIERVKYGWVVTSANEPGKGDFFRAFKTIQELQDALPSLLEEDFKGLPKGTGKKERYFKSVYCDGLVLTKTLLTPEQKDLVDLGAWRELTLEQFRKDAEA